MGFSLKKTLGSVIGGKSGPSNPYSSVDTSFLNSTAGFDFLKDPNSYNFLKNPGQYDFLKDPSAPITAGTNRFAEGLPESVKTFAGTYKAPTRTSTGAFQDYLGAIDAPSSVDDVQREIDSGMLSQLLGDVDTDTRNSIGSLKSDFADRGLSGPGMISDIEGNALAQAYSDAGKTKANLRGEYAGKELERLKAKELAKREAYGTRYGTEAGFDSQDQQIAAQGALSDASSFNEMLRTRASLGDSEAARILQASSTGSAQELQRKLGYAGFLQGEDEQYADALTEGQKLFAQLLNARDLGKVGVQAGLFNAGADREIAGRRPGATETLLGNTRISLGF